MQLATYLRDLSSFRNSTASSESAPYQLAKQRQFALLNHLDRWLLHRPSAHSDDYIHPGQRLADRQY